MRFVEGRAWEDTPYFREGLESIRRGRPFWHQSSSLDELEARSAAFDRLFAVIDSTGYLLPPGVLEGRSGLCIGCSPKEVKVSIGRRGILLLQTGRHRLSIARILSLPEIPVQVAARHSKWQEFREAALHGHQALDHDSSMIHHPDVTYLT